MPRSLDRRPRPARRTLPLLTLAACLAGGPALAPAAASGASPGAAQARWRWPVPPPVHVVRGFEAPAGPYAPGHRGVDLAAPIGSVVVAAGAGTVVLAGAVAGRSVVVVAHGDARSDDELRTTYEPVEPTVRVGAQVAPGARLGHVGTWPGHCPAAGCLHWGLRRGRTYLDPLTLLRGPVRLLPLGAPVPVTAAQGTEAALAPLPREPQAPPPRASDPGEPTDPGSPRRGSSAPAVAAVTIAGGAGVVASMAARRARARRANPSVARRGSSP